MKKIVMLSTLLCLFVEGIAQVKFPQQSVKGKVEQVVGLTEIEVDYTRPAKRGRTVFGQLVPYNQLWRTGANQNTTIEFSDDVTIANQTLPKGKYALYTKPTPTNWTFYFYKKNDNWGLANPFDNTQVALEAQANSFTSPREDEYFTIELNPIDYNSGKLVLRWDTTTVELPFTVHTPQQVAERINQLNANSSAREYYEAAAYLLNTNGDMKKADELITQSIKKQSNPPFYMLRVQADIYSKVGKTKQAIKAAETALAKAQKAGNQEYVNTLQTLIATLKKK